MAADSRSGHEQEPDAAAPTRDPSRTLAAPCETPEIPPKRRLRAVLKGLLLIATMSAAGVALHAAKLDQNLDRHVIAAHLDSLGALGWLAFVAGAGLLTAVGLPRQIPAFIGGYVFGVVWGTALAALGAVLGCAMSFLYSRFLGRDLVRKRFGRRIKAFEEFVNTSPVTMTILIRLMPVGNNTITNLLAGLTSIRLAPYLLGSAIGYLPQTFIFALIGKGVRVDPGLRIGIACVLFVATTLWGFVLYRKYRCARLLNEANGSSEAEDAAADSCAQSSRDK